MTTEHGVLILLSGGRIGVLSQDDSELTEFKWSYFINQGGHEYCIRNPTRKRVIYLHRVILSRVLARELLTSERVDHKDGNGLNNQRSNLRLATTAQNNANSGLRTDNTSGYKGVSYDKGMKKWVAQICINKKRVILGYFENPELAYSEYRKTAIIVFGEFAEGLP